MNTRACVAVVLSMCAWCVAAEPVKPLVTFKPDFDVTTLKLTGAAAEIVTVDGVSALQLKTQAEPDYPGASFPAPEGDWDLSAHTGVDAVVTNAGKAQLRVCLRVDNAGDWKTSPWNTAHVSIDAGQTKTIHVTFGQSDGQPGFALDPAHVKRVQVFAIQPKAECTFVVKQIQAVGTSGAAKKDPAAPSAPAGDAKTLPLVDLAKTVSDNHLEPTADVSVAMSEAGKGVVVTLKPGETPYPGVRIKPPGEAFDLSRYGHVAAQVTNTSDKPLRLNLRVDNAGRWQDEPWNTEFANIEPGKTATITVIFGHAWGKKPGYKLKPEAVVGVLLFTGKTESEQSFRIESLTAGGLAGEKP